MRSRRVGTHALLVILDGPVEALATSARIRELAHELGAGLRLRQPADVVPAATTVLLDGLPDTASVQAWEDWLAGEAVPALGSDVGDEVPGGSVLTLETTYDGADLDVVADAWSGSREAVVARHQAAEFLVAFCGFAPGFAYCTSTPPLPGVPRRDTPRERVASGSVALAAEYCGVYPRELPGGWQLIGRTAATIFDPARERPALLVPGDRVRFRARR